jgi:hypothetical protein
MLFEHGRQGMPNRSVRAAPRAVREAESGKIMFKRLLIANRGEIAIRIVRAAADLGVESVAVYTDDDAARCT